jgi:hypothetical protein
MVYPSIFMAGALSMAQQDPPAGTLVTIARILEPVDAQILQGRLEAEGIPTFLADQQLIQTYNLIAIAVGGVRLQVSAGNAERARAVLAAVAEGRYELSDDTPVGDGPE